VAHIMEVICSIDTPSTTKTKAATITPILVGLSEAASRVDSPRDGHSNPLRNPHPYLVGNEVIEKFEHVGAIHCFTPGVPPPPQARSPLW
jgi:hypothetical protein